MPFETIALAREGAVAVLTFARPHVLNAFDPALIAETNRAMTDLARDETVRAIMVRGAGRAFSAGFDLKAGVGEAARRGPEDWRRILEADFEFIMQFWDCPKPTVAAIHGYCLGGAFELALACDVSVAAQGTRFGCPEVKFGSGAVALLLPFVVGAKAAKELALTGDDHLDAERALALGVVNHVTPGGEEMAKAMALAQAMAGADPLAVRLSKRALNRSYEAMGLRVALAQALECEIFIESAGGPTRAAFDRIRKDEGLAAALAWRDRARSARGEAGEMPTR